MSHWDNSEESTPGLVGPPAAAAEPQPASEPVVALTTPLEKEDANRQDPVRNKMGVWLKPGDPDYEATKAEMERQGASWNVAEAALTVPVLAESVAPLVPATKFNDDSLKETQDEKKQDLQEKKDERRDVVQELQKTVAVNEGSIDPHLRMDEAVLQKIRAGASTVALKDALGKLKAVTGSAYAGVEDVNPEKLGQTHPDQRVTGTGADMAYARAQKEKERQNALFTEQQRRKQKGET